MFEEQTRSRLSISESPTSAKTRLPDDHEEAEHAHEGGQGQQEGEIASPARTASLSMGGLLQRLGL